VCARIHLHVHLPAIHAYPNPYCIADHYAESKVYTYTKTSPYTAAAPVGGL